MASAGLSLVNQQHLLTKIYFPRLFVPTAAVGAFLVDLADLAGHLRGRCWPSTASRRAGRSSSCPLVVLLTIAATLGLGYSLAALTVLYRDFRYVVPF